jgi:tetratricopeptide (TPR) repeat protein
MPNSRRPATPNNFNSTQGYQFNNAGSGIQINNPTFNGDANFDRDSWVKRQNEVLRSLDVAPYRDQRPHADDGKRDTLYAFLENPAYQSWQASESSQVLWAVSSGVDKSVITAYLADSLPTKDGSRATGYFFFRGGGHSDDLNKITTALCCILHQIFDQDRTLLTERIVKKFESRQSIVRDFHGLWDILLKAAEEKRSGKIICLLDAVNECEQKGRANLMESLSALLSSQGRCRCNLKVWITSSSTGLGQSDLHFLEKQELLILYIGAVRAGDEATVSPTEADAEIPASLDPMVYTLASFYFRMAERKIDTSLGHWDSHLHYIQAESLNSLAYLALSLQAEGNYEAAERLLRTVWHRSDKVFGRLHLVTIHHQGDLAMCILLQRKFREAEQIFHDIVAKHERLSGRFSERTLYALWELGWCQLAHGRSLLKMTESRSICLQNAEMVFRDVHERRRPRQQDSPNFEKIAEDLLWLGRSLYEQQKHEDAQRCLKEGLQPGLARDDLLSIQILWLLGESLREQEKYAEAEAAYRGCHEELHAHEQLLAPDHRDTVPRLVVLNRIGTCHLARGRFKDARKAFWEAYEGQLKTLRQDHKETRHSKMGLETAMACQETIMYTLFDSQTED